jgi:hypothetical protein
MISRGCGFTETAFLNLSHYRELADREERADKARAAQTLEQLRLKRRTHIHLHGEHGDDDQRSETRDATGPDWLASR